MLKSQNPELALVDIRDYKLWNIVFEIPQDSTLIDPNQINKIPQHSYYLLD